MNLYLVRHGTAAGGEKDPGLSARGINEVWRIAEFLRDRARAAPVEILYSTKRRARETAEILGEALDVPHPLREARGLSPNDPVDAWAADLLDDEDEILVVGHLPFLARLAGRMLTGREEGSPINLSPAGVVGISRDRQRVGAGELRTRCSLVFLVAPELLPTRPTRPASP